MSRAGLIFVGAVAACAGSNTAGPATSAPAAATAPAPAARAAPPPAPPAEEASVRPGANKDYLRPDLEVAPWVERFERSGREIFDQRGAIVKAVGLQNGSVIVDLGAGTGLFTMLFAEAVGTRGRVYAVDIVPKFIQHIETRTKEQKVDNVTAVLGSEKSVPVPESAADVVFLCDVYHHFEYPRSMLAAIRKALRPGGALVLIDFQREPGKSEAWVLEHVRAGRDVVVGEVTAAGFEKVEELPLLKQNYFVRFRKPAS